MGIIFTSITLWCRPAGDDVWVRSAKLLYRCSLAPPIQSSSMDFYTSRTLNIMKIFSWWNFFGYEKISRLFSVDRRSSKISTKKKRCFWWKSENPIFRTFGTRSRRESGNPRNFGDFRKNRGFTAVFRPRGVDLPVFSGGIDILDSGEKARGMKFPSN